MGSQLALRAIVGWRDHFYYEAGLSAYAACRRREPVSLQAGKQTFFFAGQHWTLQEVAAGHENGFYSPGTLCLTTRRNDLDYALARPAGRH